jgi:hypothetical protein
MASNLTISKDRMTREKAIMDAKMEASAQVPQKKTMLHEAHDATAGDRKRDYGLARENHQNIADMWSVILKTEVTPEQVVLCMMQVKMSRLINSPNHRDSWVDIAGYVAVKDKMDNGE